MSDEYHGFTGRELHVGSGEPPSIPLNWSREEVGKYEGVTITDYYNDTTEVEWLRFTKQLSMAVFTGKKGEKKTFWFEIPKYVAVGKEMLEREDEEVLDYAKNFDKLWIAARQGTAIEYVGGKPPR